MSEPRIRWTIVLGRQLAKELRRLPDDVLKRVDKAIAALAEDPQPAGCIRVRQAPKGTYRIRVGGYRVIYALLDSERVVVVVRVRKRDEGTYRGL